MRVYVASSWRNVRQPEVVRRIRAAGHEVYDFRNPGPGGSGFSWHEIDPGWQGWTPETFRAALSHPVAQEGFRKDMTALRGCDVCLLVLPCGRSAHLEFGWAIGAGKTGAILLSDGEPELMYRMAAGTIFTNLDDVLKWLRKQEEWDKAVGTRRA